MMHIYTSYLPTHGKFFAGTNKKLFTLGPLKNIYTVHVLVMYITSLGCACCATCPLVQFLTNQRRYAASVDLELSMLS